MIKKSLSSETVKQRHWHWNSFGLLRTAWAPTVHWFH